MDLQPEYFEAFWVGAFLTLKCLGVTFLWCLVAGIINKGIGG